jgi:putative tricarboxylic transport membrane protein
MSAEADRQEAEPPATDQLIERLLQLAVAAAVVAFGLFLVWEAREIRVPPVHSRVGPRVIPYLVGSGLVVVGIWLVFEALTGRAAAPTSDDAEDVDPTLRPDWRCLATIGVGLLLFWLLIERAGFVIASALLFFLAAFGMGSRRLVRDAAIAVALSFAVYVVFTEGLNLRLPAGWLDAPLSGLGLG